MVCYIYIDESGDLGMDGKGSNHFIFSAIKISTEEDHKKIKRISKKVREKIMGKKNRRKPELKFSNSSPLIRDVFLEMTNELNIEIYSLIIKKKYTSSKLKSNLPILYNYLLGILIEKLILNLDRGEKVNICMDKCMSASQRIDFEVYINTKFFHNIIIDELTINIVHECSHNNPALIVTDYICGAFGYKYNTSNLGVDKDRYVKKIETKIILEKNDFFSKEKTDKLLKHIKKKKAF